MRFKEFDRRIIQYNRWLKRSGNERKMYAVIKWIIILISLAVLFMIVLNG